MKNKSMKMKYLLLTVLFAALFYSMLTGVIAFATESDGVDLPTKEEVNKYTDSDYLYNDETQSINTSYTIRDYSQKLWNVKYKNDDMIVQIVPKAYFYSECDTTIVGKEYGFYVKTTNEGYRYCTIVFVFDITIVSNSFQNEFSYTVEPLYAYKYYVKSSGVCASVEDHPDMSDYYYLTNVSYGFTVFNENNYNSQDSFGYTKNDDDGPVIMQTRYNCNGYSGTDWQGDIGDVTYLLIKRIAVNIPVYGNYIASACDIIDYVSDGKTLLDCFVWENTPYTRNNELNIITYKDKNSYAEDEPYLRTSVLMASDEVVYKSKCGHYSQGILLLGSINGDYRIYENIKVDIATVNVFGKVETISSGERSEYSVHSNNYREEMESNTNELVYTLPYGKKMFRFTPEYSGE